jgi:hypothetical protein
MRERGVCDPWLNRVAPIPKNFTDFPPSAPDKLRDWVESMKKQEYEEE